MGQRAKAPAPVGVIGKHELPRAPVVKKERRQGTGVLPPQKPKRKPRNKSKIPERPDYALAAVVEWRTACLERARLLRAADRVRWLAVKEMRAAGIIWRDIATITGLNYYYLQRQYGERNMRRLEALRRAQLYPDLHGRAWAKGNQWIKRDGLRTDYERTGRITRWHAERDLLPYLEDLGGPYLVDVAGGGYPFVENLNNVGPPPIDADERSTHLGQPSRLDPVRRSRRPRR